MITEKDLQEAIAECQGQRNPNANTCIKLAAFLTIKRELFGDQEETPVPSYSFAPSSEVAYDSGSEFLDAVKGSGYDEALRVMDELMDALHVLNPRLYDSVMRKLK